MKANELMIGDWVKVKNLCNLYADWYTEKISVCHFYSEATSKFEPIPLTEKILAMNGFKCRKTYACPRYSYIDDKGHKLISFLRDMNGYEMQVGGNRVRLHYVHQLQHALRLCSLNDIADNFKVN